MDVNSTIALVTGANAESAGRWSRPSSTAAPPAYTQLPAMSERSSQLSRSTPSV